MKMSIKPRWAFYALTLISTFASCKKSDMTASTDLSGSDYIAAAAELKTSASSTTPTDSVYLMQRCKHGDRRELIDQSALPSAVTSYITANYNGAVFSKAFALKNNSGGLSGYAVVVYYNNTPVGLLFDVAGSFIKVLEQREKCDLGGPGWHLGGRFEHRDGRHRDTIALSALPVAITNYFASNYPGDTLLHVFRKRDSSIVVISKNNGLFGTAFDGNSNFINRIQLPPRPGMPQPIDISAVPATVVNYLSQSYPGYVLDKAFALAHNGNINGYLIIIDANNLKYAVLFDGSGNFLQAKVIH
jgi:hypothetical protein